MSPRKICIVCALLAACGTNSTPTATASFNIVDLGQMLPSAINNNDEIVGSLGDSTFHPVYWKAGVMTALKGSTGARDTANAINDAGQIAGHVSGSADGETAQAVLWESSTASPTTLTAPAGVSDIFTDALGLDAGGDAVGYGFDQNIIQRAIVWKHGAAAVALKGLGSSTGDAAWSLNASGLIVGTSAFQGQRSEQISWVINQPTVAQDLGVAVTAASTTHVDTALLPVFINAAGLIAGTQQGTGGVGLAYVRTAGGQVTSITASDPTQSQATGINTGGTVILDLNPDNVGATQSAAVFDTAGGLRLLDSLVTPGLGWKLQFATGINDAGKIVGVGQFQGATHGFLLTPN
jgi:uncharacterized membrane protein